MNSETVAAVIPYLELDNQQIPQTTARFTEGSCSVSCGSDRSNGT